MDWIDLVQDRDSEELVKMLQAVLHALSLRVKK